MPVEGLPSTLESLLNAVRRENTISSFKIDGKGIQTTVALRLTAKSSIQPPVTEDSSVVYRRKCPSQVSRDRRRAEADRTGSEKKASTSSPSGLFLPTPSSLCSVADQRKRNVLPLTFLHIPPAPLLCHRRWASRAKTKCILTCRHVTVINRL